MQQLSPEQFLVAEAGSRARTDYRFSWGTYFWWNVLTLGCYRYYGTYRLVERRKRHVQRRLAFSSYLWHTLAGRADAAGRRAEVQEGLDNLSRIHAQIESHERSHSREPVLWLLLHIFIGFYGLIFFIISHLLHSDYRFLETWEHSLGQNVEWVMRRLGYDVQLPPRDQFGIEPVPARSTAMYVVLSILTLGLFTLYWRYTQMADGNAHFDSDDRMEDAILGGLGLTTGGYGFGQRPVPVPPPSSPAPPPFSPPPPEAGPPGVEQ